MHENTDWEYSSTGSQSTPDTRKRLHRAGVVKFYFISSFSPPPPTGILPSKREADRSVHDSRQ